ncbi:MAG: hypothetical protein Q4C57_08540 [Bacillota bacterium]|nr:hypothetical protein [Bacillota bacterium]
MEIRCSGIFYMGIAKGERARRKQLERDGLSIHQVERRFPYLLWEGRNLTAYVQIYFTLLPQYEKRLFSKDRIWDLQEAGRLLERAGETAADLRECRERIFARELGGVGDDIPKELLAVCLHRKRPFEQISIRLPQTGGEEVDQAVWLLRPYLTRIRQIFLCGEWGEQMMDLEERLYREFGIMTQESLRPPEGILLLDLRSGEALTEDGGEQKGSGSRNGGCVNCTEALKFLDTTVKNGYNTGVN